MLYHINAILQLRYVVGPTIIVTNEGIISGFNTSYLYYIVYTVLFPWKFDT